ncbi:TonB family protein [Lampropedia puyangensis]|uniref:energy transducer TonB n=1 Tax=Lampropedia puyangensis TaxID=1330072 RepID=UPI0026BC6C67
MIVSLTVHAVLLTIRFVSPQTFDRLLNAQPLEIILVNAQTDEKPEESKALAQVAMAGGGDADSGRATSPTPYSALTRIGSDSEDAQQREETPREKQNRTLAELRKVVAEYPLPDPRKENLSPDEIAQEEKRLLLVQQLAEMEKLVKLENERPKKRYVSPATQDSPSALYLDNVRRAIEERGTTRFPEQNGKKLYGQLVVTVLINFDGSILEVDIQRSSGNLSLDRIAEAIVYAAGPFGYFTPEIRRTADQIGFTSTFDFKRDATLVTEF